MNTPHLYIHCITYNTGGNLGKAKALAAALSPIAGAMSEHSVCDAMSSCTYFNAYTHHIEIPVRNGKGFVSVS